ncbi:MAG: hydroxymethylbilane synthase [Candidatus Omnitrophica bacterium]|nr:hydroxymethylbilane synthase [Candidatus Omnitrophota bacterium]
MGHGLIRVGTRKSQLALTQTHQVIAILQGLCPGQEFEVKTISTAGDRSTDHAAFFDHQGIFVKEIEEALLRGDIDLGIHSLKDMPCDIKAGLELGAVSARLEARDAFLTRDGVTFKEMKPGARIGTSSVRRRAQVLLARPDLQVVDMRGNVDTRLRKLQSGEVDGIIIACAGLMRLGFEQQITECMPLDVMLPAPCQGVLALEIRCDDTRSKDVVRKFNHPATYACITAERTFLKTLGGGCSLPVGALATVDGETLTLTGQVVDPDGKRKVQDCLKGFLDQAADTGKRLAEQLVEKDGPWIKGVLQSPYPKRMES